MFSNRYIFTYTVIMVVIVATLLATASNILKPIQQKNVRVEKIQNILSTIGVESSYQDAQDLYDKYIREELVLNNKGEIIEGYKAFDIDLKKELRKDIKERKLPLFIAQKDNHSMNYIIPLYGRGLWGPVWGYISIQDDLNTVLGAKFDHKSETPGLGAEISTRQFQEQFVGKKIYNESGAFVSIAVIKGGAEEGNPHVVDAISGGTITSNGVHEMLLNCIEPYLSYFDKIQSEKAN
jgi:Na+-transporting NADH:ubiquinone oxidoreductase subunit C